MKWGIKMFFEMMDQAKMADKLVAVYTDLNNTTKFSVGYIVDFDENYYILKRVSPQGEDDGYLLGKTKYIYRVECDTLYIRKIAKLMKHNGTTKRVNTFESGNLLLSFISFVCNDKRIMAIELLESGNNDAIGYIHGFSSSHCTVQQISELGEFDGYTTIKLEDISFVIYNSEEQKVLEILNNS